MWPNLTTPSQEESESLFLSSSDIKSCREGKFDLVAIDICNTNILICQITKPSKQLKNLSNNGNINLMVSH